MKQHEKNDFKYIITLDESWFYLHNEQEYMYADSPEKVIPIVNNTISKKKINVTIAFVEIGYSC